MLLSIACLAMIVAIWWIADRRKNQILSRPPSIAKVTKPKKPFVVVDVKPKVDTTNLKPDVIAKPETEASDVNEPKAPDSKPEINFETKIEKKMAAVKKPQPKHETIQNLPVRQYNTKAKDNKDTLVPTESPRAKLATNDDAKPNTSTSPIPRVESDKTSQDDSPARVFVSVAPAAEIFINGKRSGTTNDSNNGVKNLTLNAGRYKIELRRQGFISHVETLKLENGESRSIGPIELKKDSAAQRDIIRVTFTTSYSPLRLSVLDRTSGKVIQQTMNGSTLTLSLNRSVYEVSVSDENGDRKRRLDLSNAQRQMTFNADFRD
jgi:hypothetical protein